MSVSKLRVLFLFGAGAVIGITAYMTLIFGKGWSNSRTSAASLTPVPTPETQLRTVFTSFEPIEEIPLAQAQRSINNFVGSDATAEYRLQVYKLMMEISVEDNTMSPITAEVFVPQSDDVTQQFPLLVYAPGTTGLDDRCAPSREDRRNPSLGNYRNQMVSQASQGFVVVMPNYEGLDNPDRLHYYFSADLEARTLLGAAKVILESAQTRTLPIQPGTLFLGGYSQGGHAVFAAADRASLYTPNLRVSGVIGHGPTTDTNDLLLNNPNLAPYFVYAYRDYYGERFPAEQVLLEIWMDRLGAAKDLCVDEAFAYNSTRAERMYTPEFLQALRDDTVTDNFPSIGQVLGENDAGLHYSGTPTLILQGTNDPIVTLDNQKEFVLQLCQNAVPVSLKEYQGLDHFGVRQQSFADTTEWMQQVSQGLRVESTCTGEE